MSTASIMMTALLVAAMTTPSESAGTTKTGGPPAAGGSAKTDGGNDGNRRNVKVGDWFRTDDGIKFSVTRLKLGHVSPWASGGRPGGPAVIITLTFVNTGSRRYDRSLIDVAVRMGPNGEDAEEVFDDRYGNPFDGTLAPGRRATTRLMYAAVSRADLKKVSIEVTPGIGYESGTFEGGL